MSRHDDPFGNEPPEGVPNPSFVREVMESLEGTNFIRGWHDPSMYEDFLLWCEHDERAEEIIAGFAPGIERSLSSEALIGNGLNLEAEVTAELIMRLLEAYESQKIADFLDR